MEPMPLSPPPPYAGPPQLGWTLDAKQLPALAVIEFFINHPKAPIFLSVSERDVDGEVFIQHLQVRDATAYDTDSGKHIEIEFWEGPTIRYELDQAVSVIVANEIKPASDQALPGQ
jgi:hypothetical protein